MPKTKRAKIVSLTKTKKKTIDHKESLVKKIQEALDKYQNCFVFQHLNMTTQPFREIQAQLADSKFFLGKNKVMQIAFGKNEESSYKENSYLVSKKEIAVYYFQIRELKKFNSKQFINPNANMQANIYFQKAGSDVFSKFSHSIEPYLRKLGLNTTLSYGEIKLDSNYILAEKDQPLNTEQCKILKLLNTKLDKFKINIVCYLKNNGTFKELVGKKVN